MTASKKISIDRPFFLSAIVMGIITLSACSNPATKPEDASNGSAKPSGKNEVDQPASNGETDDGADPTGGNEGELDLEVFASDKKVSKAGEVVRISGKNFKEDLVLEVNGVPVATTYISETEASFVMPAGVTSGMVEVTKRSGRQVTVVLSILINNDELPLSLLDPSKVCSDTEYYNSAGELITGTRTCETIACTADGAVGCKTTSSFAAANTASIAGKVLSGQSVAGILGTATLPSAGQVLAGVSYGGGGNALLGTLVLPNSGKVLTGEVFGVGGNSATGALTLPDPAQVATGITYGSGNALLGTLVLPNSGKVLTGEVFGVGGNSATGALTLPNPAQVLTGITYGSGSALLGTLVLPNSGKVLTGEVFGVGGNSATGALTLPDPAQVRTGNGAFGVDGNSLTPSLDNCLTNNVAGCVTAGSYKSADWTNLTSENIKNGSTVAGVSGSYPSTSHPLTGASATLDLELSNFEAKLRSNTAFEWFGPDGTAYTRSGDSNFTAANISNLVTLFGVTGTLPAGIGLCTTDGQLNCITAGNIKAADTTAISTWDLRIGKTFGSISGALKTNCRNRIVSTAYNNDAFPLTNLAVTSGTSLDWWDTSDDGNVGEAFPTQVVADWTTATSCGKEVWEDVTAGTCTTAAKDCVMKDRITGLQWSESNPVTGIIPTAGAVDWTTAMDQCSNLTFAGYSDWRTGTQKEMMSAYEHGIKNIGYAGVGTVRPGSDTLLNNDYFLYSASNYWTASSVSPGVGSSRGWYVNLGMGNTGYSNKANTLMVICVRSD